MKSETLRGEEEVFAGFVRKTQKSNSRQRRRKSHLTQSLSSLKVGSVVPCPGRPLRTRRPRRANRSRRPWRTRRTCKEERKTFKVHRWNDYYPHRILQPDSPSTMTSLDGCPFSPGGPGSPRTPFSPGSPFSPGGPVESIMLNSSGIAFIKSEHSALLLLLWMILLTGIDESCSGRMFPIHLAQK